VFGPPEVHLERLPEAANAAVSLAIAAAVENISADFPGIAGLQCLLWPQQIDFWPIFCYICTTTQSFDDIYYVYYVMKRWGSYVRCHPDWGEAIPRLTG
jgi:hypothetical protein